MFTKRKTKNKRFARKHVLNVTMRTSQRRKLRIRKTVWTLTLTFLLGFSFYVAWRGGDAFLRWAVLDNPYFSIHKIVVETDGIIRKTQIRQWAGVRPGLNLFRLDLTRVRRDLEFIPMIATAEIERVLPDTIKIRVREREAVAQLAVPKLDDKHQLQKNVFTLDAEGHFMVPLLQEQCTVSHDAIVRNLPYLVGVEVKELRPGYQVETQQLRDALKLITAFNRSPMAGLVDIHQVDIRQPGILQVKTLHNTRITFSPDNLDRQMQRWSLLHHYCRGEGKHMISLDLSVTNNVPLTWRDLSRRPASFERLNPQSSYQLRKKNV